MTIRRKLVSARRGVFLILVAAFIIFAIGLVRFTRPYGEVGFILGAVAWIGAIFYSLFFGVRCPRCKGNLRFALQWPPVGFFRVSPKIRFCQYCGVPLDTELDEVEPQDDVPSTPEEYAPGRPPDPWEQ
jgi:hypothetical protein